MDYFTKLKLWAWFEGYFQPSQIKRREIWSPNFKQEYFNSLAKDLQERGECCISKYDSITGEQIYFSDDPNKIL